MGIDKLLETIVLVSEMAGSRRIRIVLQRVFVIEAKIDKGRGPVATFLVQNGTLRSGDYV